MAEKCPQPPFCLLQPITVVVVVVAAAEVRKISQVPPLFNLLLLSPLSYIWV